MFKTPRSDILTFSSGHLLRIPKLSPASLLSLMDGEDEVLRKPKDMPQAEVPIFVDFLEGMLAVEPGDRKSAAQMLKHPWLAIENTI
jgi:serine/threonine-protein kinase SRPK3